MKMLCLIMFAMTIMSCEPPKKDGHLGSYCKVDGTCVGNLRCVKSEIIYHRNTITEYQCVLPQN